MSVTKEDIDLIIEISKSFGAERVMLFGSVLLDPETANDIDIAVEGIPDAEFLLYAGTIENRLRKSIDVVPIEIDNPFVRQILSKGKWIYGN